MIAAATKQHIRDTLLVTVTALLLIAVAFQVKTNNLIADRQRDSCTTRRALAVETNRRSFVWRSFIDSAATTRARLARTDANPVQAKINREASSYWKNDLLPLIHDVPIPPRC